MAPLRKPPEVAFQQGNAQLDGHPHNPGTYPLPPGPIQKSLSYKKRNRKCGRGGDFEEALAVYFRHWDKVVAVPGPLPAPSPHRREKPASPMLQEGGDRGP